MADDPDDEPPAARRMDPAEAFALLGDPTRLAVVTALHDDGLETPAPFSELYDAVDVDDTGRFNYHLGELVPHFVAKTDDGYELASAGRRIARAVAAGTYTDTPTVEPFDIDGACYACGAEALSAAYRDEAFRVECRDCEEVVLDIHVPPSVVRGREPSAVVDAVDRWSRAQVDQAARGLCPTCGGAVEPTVVEAASDAIAFDVLAGFDCTVCGRRAMTSFGALAYRHPDVAAFLRERDRSLRDRPYWEVGQCVSGEGVDVVSRDPWDVQVTFEAGGDACRVRLDGSLSVVETTVEEPAD